MAWPGGGEPHAAGGLSLQRTKDHYTEQGEENVERRQREAYDALRGGLGSFLRSTDISRQAYWLGMESRTL